MKLRKHIEKEILVVSSVLTCAWALPELCGLACYNLRIVKACAVLMILMIIVKLSAGVAAFVIRANVRNTLQSRIEASMQKYGSEDHDDVTMAWDGLQAGLSCFFLAASPTTRTGWTQNSAALASAYPALATNSSAVVAHPIQSPVPP